jgi:hypothetical protein
VQAESKVKVCSVWSSLEVAYLLLMDRYRARLCLRRQGGGVQQGSLYVLESSQQVAGSGTFTECIVCSGTCRAVGMVQLDDMRACCMQDFASGNTQCKGKCHVGWGQQYE